MIAALRRHRLTAPVATALAVGAVWAATATLGPDRVMPLSCPLFSLTGLACPFCGGLRAAHALGQGDLVAAVGYNALAVAAAPLLAGVWVGWLIRRWGGDRGRRPGVSGRALLAVAVVLVTFGVVRNLPSVQWLAP
jgi:Protein of unknown function (DUF2752)